MRKTLPAIYAIPPEYLEGAPEPRRCEVAALVARARLPVWAHNRVDLDREIHDALAAPTTYANRARLVTLRAAAIEADDVLRTVQRAGCLDQVILAEQIKAARQARMMRAA